MWVDFDLELERKDYVYCEYSVFCFFLNWVYCIVERVVRGNRSEIKELK